MQPAIPKGNFLDRDAKLSKIGVRGKLGDARDALVVRVDEATITTLCVERAHTADTEALKTDDTGNALAGLEYEAWRGAGEEDGAVAVDVCASAHGHETGLLYVVVFCLSGCCG
ncbi:hypothetical protein HG531_003781 [Fusarium graminearum]|nr:hypothetical protein HG531_003781 [Fusarium graminearum]